MLKPVDPDNKPQGDERPIGELVRQLVEDGKAYAKAEFGVVEAIARAKGKALILPAGLFVAAFFFGLATIMALAIGLFFVFYSLMSAILAGLLTVLIFAATAAGLGWYAVQRLKQVI